MYLPRFSEVLLAQTERGETLYKQIKIKIIFKTQLTENNLYNIYQGFIFKNTTNHKFIISILKPCPHLSFLLS